VDVVFYFELINEIKFFNLKVPSIFKVSWSRVKFIHNLILLFVADKLHLCLLENFNPNTCSYIRITKHVTSCTN